MQIHQNFPGKVKVVDLGLDSHKHQCAHIHHGEKLDFLEVLRLKKVGLTFNTTGNQGQVLFFCFFSRYSM